MMDTEMMIALAIVLGTAIWTDLRSGLIPNRLTFSTMGLAILLHGWLNGFPGMVYSLTGLGTGFALFIFFYLTGGMGAGDVKLMAAIGAIIGAYGVLISGVLAIMAGGIYALGALCYQWGFLETCRKLSFATYGAFHQRGEAWNHDLQLPFRLRYGIPIAAGTLLFSLGFNPFEG